jgi:hypothetical protein
MAAMNIAKVALLATLAACAAGCAASAKTPAQEQVYARYEVCKVQYPRYRLIRVARDGQFWYQPADADGAAFAICLMTDPVVHESPQIHCEPGSVSSVCTHPETYRGGMPR